MSRSNSMTSSGQCRLAPLIQCIQDSSQLYDYCVRILFKLYAQLPPDVLSGHRTRFLKQFHQLRQFYLFSSNLQYFKNLIQIPLLPEVRNKIHFLSLSVLGRGFACICTLFIKITFANRSLMNSSTCCDLTSQGRLGSAFWNVLRLSTISYSQFASLKANVFVITSELIRFPLGSETVTDLEGVVEGVGHIPTFPSPKNRKITIRKQRFTYKSVIISSYVTNLK